MAKKNLYSLFTVILLIMAGFLVIGIAAYTSIFGFSLSSYFRDNVNERLLFISRMASKLVTPEELNEFHTPIDMEKPLFAELKQRLIEFGEEADILFVYYLRLIDGGTVRYIIDNDVTDKTVNLTTKPIEAEPALQKAFSEGVSAVTTLGVYSPGEEGLLTAYSPIFDRNGKITAIVGVDIHDEQILFMRNRMFIHSVIIFISAAAVVIIGIFSFIFNRKKQLEFLNRVRQQELMSQLSRTFISPEDSATLISGALRITGEFLGISRMVIFISDADTGISHASYIWASSDNVVTPSETSGLSELIRFPVERPSSIPTVVCDDVQKDSRYEALNAIGIKAFIWAPLYVEGRYWAVLSIEEFKPRIWTQSDRQLVSTVSSVIAGAIERELREKERDAARQAAERANKAKTNFLANMSHEMRTPMNAIIGMTAIAKSSHDLEKKEYCLTKIENASTHLLGVINDILDMSKIEANKFELSSAEFNFEKMLQKVVNVINFRVEEKRQVFSVRIDKNIPGTLLGDDQRLAQVVANLLSNAVKFTPEGGSVHLNAGLERMEGDICTIEISVKDSGIGISAEQQARLFHSFEQADSSTSRQFGGTGLGLVISKRIVEMMGGAFRVVSELGKGAEFAFTVKLQEATGSLESVTGPDDWSAIKVLAVDDDPVILEYFRDIAGRVGFYCDTASDGEEALEKIKENRRYDIFFIDWRMPNIDGIELSRRIKKSGDNAIIIMISAVDWNTVEVDAKEAGVDSFLSKPLFPSVVAECISRCLQKNKALSAEGPAPDDAERFDGKRLLLAEDVDINREIVLSLLEPTGLLIDCAKNGKEAVSLFKQSPELYDMIFMDVQMPEMDGYEATRQIRAFEAERRASGKIPIIAMTANVFKEDVERCLEAGMNGHVGKPLDFNEVIGLMRSYL
ncbi:MAG: response regulator [Treponema sp.]|nr:response regulator [Treponema sp.]